MTDATLRERTHESMLLIFLGTVAMLFAAFVASYLVRRSAPDWRHAGLPPIAWANLAALAAASATLEVARRAAAPRPWLATTLGLGLVFAAGQAVAWSRFEMVGPQRSFFVVLAVVHVLHVLGGIGGLVAAVRRPTPGSLRLCGWYWHFMGGIWAALLAIVTLL